MPGSTAPVILNELATQHDPAFRREFLCLTSEGLLRFLKVRPVDQLADLLRRHEVSDEDRNLQKFFDCFNHAEACSMCL